MKGDEILVMATKSESGSGLSLEATAFLSEGRNLVPRALFSGFGVGRQLTSKAREKRPGDEVAKDVNRKWTFCIIG